MTKNEALLLDVLLDDFTKPESKGYNGYVHLKNVVDGNNKLKRLTETELKKLLL